MPQAEFDFSAHITNHTRDFTGREWVFAEIDQWLADPNAPRYFIVTGEPGIGKTSIAARLTQIYDLAATHFCIARQADTIDPLNFARSLSHQFTRIDGFAEGILEDSNIHLEARQSVQEAYGQAINVQIENLVVNAPTATVAFNRVVGNPLRRLYAGGFDSQVVTLVDALDSVVLHHGPETIVDLIANVHGLPLQARFVLTSRPESTALRHFEQSGALCLSLDTDREENLQDVRRYIRHQLETSVALQAQLARQRVQSHDFVERVASASQGNFLYLVWQLRAISEGVQELGTLEILPEGLDDIYRDLLRTCVVGQDIYPWRNRYRPLLGVLAAAQAPLTMEQIADFSGLGMQGVADLLIDTQQFIRQTEDDKYSLYHRSLIDFLGSRESAGEFWIDLAPVHEQIVASYQERHQHCWNEIDDYGIRFLLYHLLQCRMPNDVRGMLGRLDKYAVEWLFLHLKRQGRANDIGRFVNQVCDS
jgi:hypothetical protein